MKTILVAVDGSEPSLKALQLAGEIASSTGAELLLAHATEPLVYVTEAYFVPTAEVERAERERSQKILGEAAERAKKAGWKARTLSLRGPPAESIADAAAEHGADLVVVGSRGLGAVARVLLGSVADRLVHVSKKPVLVAR